MSGSKSSQRTVTPRSAAATSQGPTLPSWSMRVSTISSPGRQSRESMREKWKISEVLLRPKTISSGPAAPRKAAAAACASATMRSVSREVRKAPPSLAQLLTITSPMRSTTRAGTCDPPGASR
ncbi:MAG: hypothetical protein WA975_12165 [Mesorhizobium sp.]